MVGSSRIAVWGQLPVSTPIIRSEGRNPWDLRRSASSVVRRSLVTIATSISLVINLGTMPSNRAVFPLPTGPPIPSLATDFAIPKFSYKEPFILPLNP